MSRTSEEIASQPETWAQAVAVLPEVAERLPVHGTALAVIGCGTSYYMAQAIAGLRESAGLGRSDSYVASEFAATRPFDDVLAVSRSGTTTEVARALGTLPEDVRSVALSAVEGTPVVEAADRAVIVSFADEASVVQTRFATTALALLRAHLGEDLSGAIADARTATERALPVEPAAFDRFVFLGHGWTVGLANEAALKMREAALATTESYAAMEYRHGPISVADARTLVWCVGDVDDALVRDVEAVGATVLTRTLDPMAELILIQRAAVVLAVHKGLDPDRPRNLTRSVVLP
jgi:fructoselysine-6-P-deglycase FrlB-like protein